MQSGASGDWGSQGLESSLSEVSRTEMREKPVGAIPRVEFMGENRTSTDHMRFLEAARPAWVSLKINHAKWLAEHGETADSWTPGEINVLTTSTIQDEDLANLRPEEEAEIINQFQPACHIGGDISVYPDTPVDQRAKLIQDCMKNAVYLDYETTDETAIIPLIKGITREEREICYRELAEFEHNFAAVYMSRYFSPHSGNQRRKAVEDVREIDEECDDVNLVLMGLMKKTLRRMPESVIASAGFQAWYQPAKSYLKGEETLGKEAALRRVWEEVEADVTDWLSEEITISETS
jgi:hypothetical protein